MPWICVGCSKQGGDSLDVMGFGLCDKCQIIAKQKRAEKRAAKYKKRK
jgi:hypothetical protein